MNRHPGAEENTRGLIERSGLPRGSRIIDLGAGGGESVRLLRSLGFDAEGIDLEPRGDGVKRDDMLHAPYPDGAFDGVLSQCAFYLSGDVPAAFAESARLLRRGGVLMLADLCFEPWDDIARRCGLRLLSVEDMTEKWKEYYIEALWRGDAPCECRRGKCAYYSALFGKD